MRSSGRVLTLALWTLLALSTGSGCHSSRPETAAIPAQVAPRLASLPATASIAWVRPSVLIADASTEDDASATLGSVRQMRFDVEAVLKGERWQVLDTDTAQYLGTIALVKRTVVQDRREGVRVRESSGRSCDSTTGICRSVPTPQPPSQTLNVPVTTERVVFVLVRRHDGARYVHAGGFLNAASSGGLFAKQVITLLRAR